MQYKIEGSRAVNPRISNGVKAISHTNMPSVCYLYYDKRVAILTGVAVER